MIMVSCILRVFTSILFMVSAAAVCGRSRSGPSKSRPKLPDGVGSNYDGAKMQQSCAAFSKAIGK